MKTRIVGFDNNDIDAVETGARNLDIFTNRVVGYTNAMLDMGMTRIEINLNGEHLDIRTSKNLVVTEINHRERQTFNRVAFAEWLTQIMYESYRE